MSDLDRFEVFALVAQLGGITEAAKRLSLSKASISKQIKQLEQHYNIVLFTRHKQRLLLTESGEILLAQCLRLKRELDDARNICHGLNSEPEGELHVAAFPYFASNLIVPKLKGFLEKYPKIELSLHTMERVPDFLKERIDLSVGFSLPVPNPDETIQKRMATTRYIVCASPDYFAKMGKPKTLDELYKHHYIEHTSRVINQALKLKSGYRVSLKPYIVLDNVNVMIECALQGLGLIQLPLYMLDSLLKQGRLMEVLSEYQATNASVYYHYPRLRYMQPKIKKFIDYFIKEPDLYADDSL